MQTFQKSYGNDKFAVLSIGNLSTKKAVENYVRDQGLRGEDPVFIVLMKGWKVYKAFGGRGTPNTFIIDKKGRVRFIHRAFNPGMEKIMKREIEALLAETT